MASLNDGIFIVATDVEAALYDKGVKTTLQTGKGPYYGVTWDKQRVYIFASVLSFRLGFVDLG